MPKRIDEEKDKKVLDYLRTHTYKQTALDLHISEKQISRIKARSQSIQPLTPESETKVLGELQGQADRVKSKETISPEKIKAIEPPQPKIRKERLTLEESESGRITIIKLMSIYEQLTGKSAPRTKGTTKNTIRDSIISILSREQI